MTLRFQVHMRLVDSTYYEGSTTERSLSTQSSECIHTPTYLPLLLHKNWLESVGEKPFTCEHVTIHLLASVDDCFMRGRCNCSPPSMHYCPRAKSTTTPDYVCPRYSNFRERRPKSGLGRCDQCEGFCWGSCTALGSNGAGWLYSMKILGKWRRLATENHSTLTNKADGDVIVEYMHADLKILNCFELVKDMSHLACVALSFIEAWSLTANHAKRQASTNHWSENASLRSATVNLGRKFPDYARLMLPFSSALVAWNSDGHCHSLARIPANHHALLS